MNFKLLFTFTKIIMLVAFIMHGNLFSQTKIYNLAVLQFDRNDNIDKSEIKTITDRFRNYINSTGAYVVLERDKMEDIFKEQDFILSDNCNSSECVVKAGQLLGVELMIAGSISKIDELYTIDLRMINVSSGVIIKTISKDYKGKREGLFEKLRIIAYEFSGKPLPPLALPKWPIKLSTSTFILSSGACIFSLIKSNSAYDKFKKSTNATIMKKYENQTKKYDRIAMYSAITTGASMIFYYFYNKSYIKSVSNNISFNVKENNFFEVTICKSF